MEIGCLWRGQKTHQPQLRSHVPQEFSETLKWRFEIFDSQERFVRVDFKSWFLRAQEASGLCEVVAIAAKPAYVGLKELRKSDASIKRILNSKLSRILHIFLILKSYFVIELISLNYSCFKMQFWDCYSRLNSWSTCYSIMISCVL
jgi:hypothetical protein